MVADLLPFFRAYQALGWSLFPCHVAGPKAKAPLTLHGFKDASPDPEQWRQWAEQYPGCAWGRPTSAEDSVIDIDPRNRGSESWYELRRKYGEPLPNAPRTATGGGGLHIGTTLLPGTRCGVLASGVDVKAEGGYVIVPPSRILIPEHEGRAYVFAMSPWVGERRPDPAILAMVADLLTPHKPTAKAVTVATSIPKASGSASGLATGSAWVVGHDDDLRTHPGSVAAADGGDGRRPTLCRLVGAHLGKGDPPKAVRLLAEEWSLSRCTPPLSDWEKHFDGVVKAEMAKRSAAATAQQHHVGSPVPQSVPPVVTPTAAEQIPAEQISSERIPSEAHPSFKRDFAPKGICSGELASGANAPTVIQTGICSELICSGDTDTQQGEPGAVIQTGICSELICSGDIADAEGRHPDPEGGLSTGYALPQMASPDTDTGMGQGAGSRSCSAVANASPEPAATMSHPQSPPLCPLGVAGEVLPPADADAEGEHGGADAVPLPADPFTLNPDAYHGIFGDMLRVVEPETEAHPASVLLSWLTLFGTAVGRGAWVTVGARRHYPTLFAGIVGRTSDAKGDSYSVALYPFREANPAFTATCIANGVGSGEGLVERVCDEVITTDAKGKPVTIPGAPDKRLVVRLSELSRAFRVGRRDSSTLSEMLREAWDGEAITIPNRKANALSSTGYSISVIGDITPEVLGKLLANGGTESVDGYANRFLWCHVRSPRSLPGGGNVGVLDAFAEKLKAVMGKAKGIGELKRDADSEALWHQVYGTLKASADTVPHTDRARPYVVRLSLIYALADGEKVIRVPHLRAALAVWEYCRRSAATLFGSATTSTQMAAAVPTPDPLWLQALTLIQNGPGISRRDIVFGLRHQGDADAVANALEALRGSGKAYPVMVKPEGRGRPGERWYPGSPDGGDGIRVQGAGEWVVGEPDQDQGEADAHQGAGVGDQDEPLLNNSLSPSPDPIPVPLSALGSGSGPSASCGSCANTPEQIPLGANSGLNDPRPDTQTGICSQLICSELDTPNPTAGPGADRGEARDVVEQSQTPTVATIITDPKQVTAVLKAWASHLKANPPRKPEPWEMPHTRFRPPVPDTITGEWVRRWCDLRMKHGRPVIVNGTPEEVKWFLANPDEALAVAREQEAARQELWREVEDAENGVE